MKRLSFLHDLKLAAMVVILIAGSVAACFRPQAKLAMAPPGQHAVTNQETLHIGTGQNAFTSYQKIDEEGKVMIKVREDQSLLQLKYSIPGAKQITLRLYDQEGSLQHIEKLMKVYPGMEKSLDFGHLTGGDYRLQISTPKGIKISQWISLHKSVKIAG